MNTVSKTPVTLRGKDSSKAEVEFCIFPQNGNETGFIERFLGEDVTIEPVFLSKTDGILEKPEREADRAGARFRVVVKPKTTKKVTAKKTTDG